MKQDLARQLDAVAAAGFETVSSDKKSSATTDRTGPKVPDSTRGCVHLADESSSPWQRQDAAVSLHALPIEPAALLPVRMASALSRAASLQEFCTAGFRRNRIALRRVASVFASNTDQDVG